MSSSPSHPLPFLPTEVKKEILKFCDQPMLAKTSTLSLAFLQLSSPLLYRHVVFEGPEPLRMFLSLVAEKRHPDLEPFLSLNLVTSVVYVAEGDFLYDVYSPGQEDDSEGFVPRRLLLNHSSILLPLPLTSLRIDLGRASPDIDILSFFDPATVRIHGGITSSRGRTSIISLDDWEGWTRLRALIFDDAFAEGRSPLCKAFSRTVKARGLSLSYNLSTTETDAACLTWLVEDLNVSPLPLVKEVIITLASEELQKAVLERLAGFPLLPRITVLVKSSNETPSNDATTI